MGNVKCLTVNEFEDFKCQYPEIAKYFDNPDLLQEKQSLQQNLNEWYKGCKKVINSMWKMKGTFIFHAPVDMEKYGITDYYQLIKKPMDFGTIKVW